MPTRQLSHLLLMSVLAIPLAASEAHAEQGAAAPGLDAVARQVSIPDETRIASDLQSRHLFVGMPAPGLVSNGHEERNYIAIRSSVRKGEILEFRVTSVYSANPNGGPRREVDSIVSYQIDGDRWALRNVLIEDTRSVTPDNPDGAAESC